MERKKVIAQNYVKLILASIGVSIIACLLAYSLKQITEHAEEWLHHYIRKGQALLIIILPSVGITTIYFLRKYIFKNRKNKGITEIYKTLDQRKDHLPPFKIVSHYLNGFLTVVSGGSTGIEVSTVVAAATVGNMAYQREFSANRYKRELVCAGVGAGVAVLFGSPLAGALFAMEVIARKNRKSLLISCATAAVISLAFILLFDGQPLFSFHLPDWKWKSLPFFVMLSLLGSLLSVYFTLLVTRVKHFFSNISNNFIRVNTGAVLTGIAIFFFPLLYGDSYHGLNEWLLKAITEEPLSLGLLGALILLKPLIAALTLGAGGDGGVFAPSIVSGALLGLLVATTCNNLLGTHLIPVNFALAGAAAMLSAAIYAPLTAIVLICGLTPNGFIIFWPVLITSFTARYFAQYILPYNVYTYGMSKQVEHSPT